MATMMPRHVLCVLGEWSDFGSAERVIRRVGGPEFELDREFSQLAPDGRMVAAFEAACDRVAPSMTKADWRAVRRHTAVAYVLSPPVGKDHASDFSGRALSVIAALLQERGVAAKGEASGIAHGRDRWTELAAAYTKATKQSDAGAQMATLYRAWVRRPIVDEIDAVFYSCGMHLLGERDIEIDSSDGPDVAVEWIDLLGLYPLVDRPNPDIEGFRPKDAGPRRVMRLGPCERYPQDDFMFNPYGYIRLGAAGKG
jgi:hypothetical protein